MNQVSILKDVKKHRSSLSIVNELLKNKPGDKFASYIDKLNQSYEKHMAKLNRRLVK